MKETFYFSHDYNARSDWKLVKLAMKYGMEWIWAYWCIIEMLYEEWWYLDIEEYERITFELRMEYKVVESIINNFWLFEKDDTKFWSNSVLDRLKQRMDKSEKARISVQKRWDKKKEEDTNVLRTNYECNTIKERKGKEIKEKDRNIKKIKESLNPIIIDNNIRYLKEKLESTDIWLTRHIFYRKMIENVSLLYIELNPKKISDIDNKLLSFKEKLWEDRAKFALESFWEHHEIHKTEITWMIWRLNTWLNNAITPFQKWK